MTSATPATSARTILDVVRDWVGEELDDAAWSRITSMPREQTESLVTHVNQQRDALVVPKRSAGELRPLVEFPSWDRLAVRQQLLLADTVVTTLPSEWDFGSYSSWKTVQSWLIRLEGVSQLVDHGCLVILPKTASEYADAVTGTGPLATARRYYEHLFDGRPEVREHYKRVLSLFRDEGMALASVHRALVAARGTASNAELATFYDRFDLAMRLVAASEARRTPEPSSRGLDSLMKVSLPRLSNLNDATLLALRDSPGRLSEWRQAVRRGLAEVEQLPSNLPHWQVEAQAILADNVLPEQHRLEEGLKKSRAVSVLFEGFESWLVAGVGAVGGGLLGASVGQALAAGGASAAGHMLGQALQDRPERAADRALLQHYLLLGAPNQ